METEISPRYLGEGPLEKGKQSVVGVKGPTIARGMNI